MELEFQMVDEKQIKIIAVTEVNGFVEKHEVGEIFTPSGSGHNNMTSIQICGFTEAFDLWGCAKYNKLKVPGVVMTNQKEQVRDIQLKFDWETVLSEFHYVDTICSRCYNVPCSCEVNIKYENPFTVKSERDLYIQKKKDEDKK